MTMMNVLKDFFQTIANADVVDVITYIMIATLLVYAPEGWYCKIPLLFLSIVGLLDAKFRRSFWMWYLSGLIIAMGIYLTWYEADNHKYVLLYICLSLSIAFNVTPSAMHAVIKTKSKALLVIAMGFAVIWKLEVSDYLSYDFFRMTLLIDERFASFAHWLTGVSFADLSTNRDSLALLKDAHKYMSNPETNLKLIGAAKVEWLAIFMTWWTVGVEAVIASLFFLSFWRNKRVSSFAHTLLCLFIVTTYAVATVPAFCLCLVMLGLGATDDEQKLHRAAYVACALLVQIYSLPFASIFGLI